MPDSNIAGPVPSHTERMGRAGDRATPAPELSPDAMNDRPAGGNSRLRMQSPNRASFEHMPSSGLPSATGTGPRHASPSMLPIASTTEGEPLAAVLYLIAGSLLRPDTCSQPICSPAVVHRCA